MKPDASVDLRSRFALRIPEAAQALGVSESTLRRLLPELAACDAVVAVGGQRRISVTGLERYIARLEAQAHPQADRLCEKQREIHEAADRMERRL